MEGRGGGSSLGEERTGSGAAGGRELGLTRQVGPGSMDG